jgi:hypothetical protein
MTIAEVPPAARDAMRARRRKEIDELDYRRQLRRLDENGYSQVQISKWLGIAQPSVSSALRTAASVPMPLEGFSGATPYEICQRYAAGLIDRARLVDELTRFPYAQGGHTDDYDSLIVDPAGTWSEVSDSARQGLIEDDVYEEVFNRRHGLSDPLAEYPTVIEATPATAAGPGPTSKPAGRPVTVKGKNVTYLIALKGNPAKGVGARTKVAQDLVNVLGRGVVTEVGGRVVVKTNDGVQLVVTTPGEAGSERERKGTGKYEIRSFKGKGVKTRSTKALTSHDRLD